MTRRTEEQMRETIEWIPVSERMPDADETVMIYAPDEDTPVMEGYFDGECWCVIPGIVGWHVTHWCAMPKGPSK
jgi:hypothetical protein